MNGIFHSVVLGLLSQIPAMIGVAFGFVLYFSKGYERPRAARLLLVALCLELFQILAVPIGYQVLFDLWERPVAGLMPLVGFVFSIPSVLAYCLLMYAAMLPDDRFSRDEDREYDDRADP